MNAPFRTFRLQPPPAPPSSGDAPYSGRAWPPIRFISLSAVLRTSLIASSLVSRIRPNRVRVAGSVEPVGSTDCPFTSSCSPRGVTTTQLLSVTDGKLRQGGTSTLRCALTPKRTSRGQRPRTPSTRRKLALRGQASRMSCLHGARTATSAAPNQTGLREPRAWPSAPRKYGDAGHRRPRELETHTTSRAVRLRA